MTTKGTTLSELAFIFKLLPLLQEVETIDRLYRLMLAIVTCGRDFGYERAMLFVPDEDDGALKGRYGVERSTSADIAPSFDEMARSVFRSFEHVDGTDLTVKARSYSVPMSWHRSALVKAARTTYPVLAERNLSEFATDTLFDFFGITSYMAVPLQIGRKPAAVLAVDRSAINKPGSVDEISVLYSLVQQTALAAERLMESSATRRKNRILAKLHESLNRASKPSEFEEGLKGILAMMGHTVGASFCILKDYAAQKTHLVGTSRSRDEKSGDDSSAVAAGFEPVLDLCAGTQEAVSGDGSHKRLEGPAAGGIAFFHACPLCVGREVFGALGVYVLSGDNPDKLEDFRPGDKTFLDLCGRGIASAVEGARKRDRIRRAEEFVQEMSSNLVRERERSRIADRGIHLNSKIRDDLDELHRIMTSEKTAATRLLKMTEGIKQMRRYSAEFETDVLDEKSRYVMADPYRIVRKAVRAWEQVAFRKGIGVTVRIPSRGPSLLLDAERIEAAIAGILRATSAYLMEGDKALVECSKTDDKVLVCVADNGAGLPGDTISRLFMPFESAGPESEDKRALSVAGDVLQKHAAEITIKSSYSWKTILILGFPLAGSRDRRKARRERRSRKDRRKLEPA